MNKVVQYQSCIYIINRFAYAQIFSSQHYMPNLAQLNNHVSPGSGHFKAAKENQAHKIPSAAQNHHVYRLILAPKIYEEQIKELSTKLS